VTSAISICRRLDLSVVDRLVGKSGGRRNDGVESVATVRGSLMVQFSVTQLFDGGSQVLGEDIPVR
jgi:hypothetical protein